MAKVASGSGQFGQLHAKSEHIKQNVHAFRDKPKVFHAGLLFSARAMYKMMFFFKIVFVAKLSSSKGSSRQDVVQYEFSVGITSKSENGPWNVSNIT